MMDVLRCALLLVTLLFTAVSGDRLCQGVRSGLVLIEHHYRFPCDASNCEHATWEKTSPTTEVGRYRNQVCSIEDAFKEDFSCKENQLFLKQAKYNDQGIYVFKCDGAENHLKLDVLYALKVNAVQTENVTLQCHAKGAKDVTWLHNNKRVLHYEMGGSMNPGEGFEGRVSLDKNCFKSGNFSLTINDLRTTDAEIYRCFVDQETTNGYPFAHSLNVDVKHQTEAPADIYKTATFILVPLVVVLFAGILVLGCLYYKARHPTPEPPPQVNHEPDTPLIEFSVQESNTSTNKPSSTVSTF